MSVSLLTIFTSSIILGFLITNKKKFLVLSYGLIFIFLIIQYNQTTPTNFFNLSEIEKIGQINRLHQYPPSGYRLGHILEERPESIIFFKLEKNFIDTLDFLLFPNVFFTIILLPLFLVGIFKSIDQHRIFSLILLCSPILLFTLIGHQNSSGPTCLYPIIFAYSLYSLIPSKFLKNEK